MAKGSAFMDYEREDNALISVNERINNYDEFCIPLEEEKRQIQSARCMNCGVPFCQSGMKLHGGTTGCPLHNLIPEWNEEVHNGHYNYALMRLLKTNNFPEFTGRVCPALCEAACICGIYDPPVTVHDNERFIIETGFERGLIKPVIPGQRSDKRVAVIGSGPGGLTVADCLNHRGHLVTVYEKSDRVGGLLMYGIPNMKLEKSVIDRRVKLMEEEGVNFVTNCNVGVDIKPEKILSSFDAVVLCCGAGKPRKPALKGLDETKGVYFALDFLKSSTKSLLENDMAEGTFISAKGKDVVIMGSGDTSNDCVAMCIRHGAKSIVQLMRHQAPPLKRAADNPWPEWPNVLRTDYGVSEAIAVFGKDPRKFGTTIKSLISEEKVLKAVEIVGVRFDKNHKVYRIKNSEQTLPCDMLLIAMGYEGCEDETPGLFGVELSDHHVVKTSEGHFDTNVEKIFTAGDMHMGQSLVVWAIVEGRKCSVAVDEYLMGYSNLYY